MERMKISITVLVLALALSGAGCTTLGPMPGVTMANPVPESRSGVEAQIATVPGFYLSDVVDEESEDHSIGQISGFLEPGKLLPLEGLSLGGRWIGGRDDDGYFEPMVRFRGSLDDEERVSLALVGYGTYASGAHLGASYEVGRGGTELTFDVRMTPVSSWAEVHLLGGGALTVISGTGTYCSSSETGWGVDCSDGAQGESSSDIGGIFPSVFAGVAVDIAEHLDIPLHGARLGANVAGGTYPRVRYEEEQNHRGSWFNVGFTLSVGFGSPG